MAGAIIRGMLSAGVCAPEEILATDTVGAALDVIAKETGARAAEPEQMARKADVILVCVKPPDVPAALRSCGPLDASKLVVSVAAGVTIRQIESLAPAARVVRVMPNTPALIHKGAAAFALGPKAFESDADVVQEIFSAVGIVLRVDEKLLDAVTGLSGSGPAFVHLMIEAMADGGVRSGLSRAQALQLAAQTVAGAAEMILRTAEHPALLKDAVASPAGTTIEGLAVLEARAARSAFIEAVCAATERSRQIGADMDRLLTQRV